MKKLGLCLLFACFMSVWATANDNDKGKSDTRTITGCLQQTSHQNEFLLKANDGSSWDVKSDTASLAADMKRKVDAFIRDDCVPGS